MSETPDLARMREVAEKAATRLTEWLDDFDRNNADDHDNDDFEVGQDELIEVPAEALRATLAAQSPLLDRIAELEGERTADAIYRREETAARLAAEAQVSALQAQMDGLRAAGQAVISHNGYEVPTALMDRLERAIVASQPPADEAREA